jgi:hypothetical protein
MKTGHQVILSAIGLFKQYKLVAEKAMLQVDELGIHWKPDPESNSIHLIVKHLSGNMQSRWTDFLTTDGEKPWRIRDEEFIEQDFSKNELYALWEKGWTILLNTLETLTEEDLSKIVLIRGEAHSVLEAINRQIAHYCYHIGQIVYIAKTLQSTQWQTLSIAKGMSEAFTIDMNKTANKIQS